VAFEIFLLHVLTKLLNLESGLSCQCFLCWFVGWLLCTLVTYFSWLLTSSYVGF